MKNKNRFLALFLAGILTAGCFSACGQSSVNQGEVQKQTEGSTVAESKTDAQGTEKELITTEPFTIDILCTRQTNATTAAEDLWCFKYFEYWLKEQGYNVTINVQQTMEKEQQISLLFGTGDLPDLIWGINLTESQAVMYGMNEGMILDWAPYINENDMPNLYNALQEVPEALVASTLPNGGVYGVPYLSTQTEGSPNTTFGMVDRMYVNKTWLESCNLDKPTDLESFLNMLRAFKNVKLENGAEVIPAIGNKGFFGRFFWIGLGWYGSDFDESGCSIAIKDDTVNMPAATEDYRTFIEIMKTCYDEGLISQDYFTMDQTTARGYIKEGVCGVQADNVIQGDAFADFEMIAPFKIGNNDQIAVSLTPAYTANAIWASADTEYPEVLALLVDYIYSSEGAIMHQYGPMKGEDPLGILSGWYYREDGTLWSDDIKDDGTVTYGTFRPQYICPLTTVGNLRDCKTDIREIAGLEPLEGGIVVKDVITGDDIVGNPREGWKLDNNDGWWRYTTGEAVSPYVTKIKLQAAYMSEEDSVRVTELKTVLEQYIKNETAKFITGIRPISEIDAYFAELKKMNVDEYIELYQKAYKSYMDEMFN